MLQKNNFLTFDLNKQQKGKRLKMLIPKQMLQRSATALSQVKASNTSEKLVNKVHQESRVQYTFVSNKSFDQLLDISLKNLIFLKTFNSEFPITEIFLKLVDLNYKLLDIEDKINIT